MTDRGFNPTILEEGLGTWSLNESPHLIGRDIRVGIFIVPRFAPFIVLTWRVGGKGIGLEGFQIDFDHLFRHRADGKRSVDEGGRLSPRNTWCRWHRNI